MFSKITFIFLLFSTILIAQTTILGGTFNGDVWTKANSPYLITGDCEIVDLTIEPGVEVLFVEDRKFEVTGTLNAQGFYSDSIYIKPHPTNTNGWAGISIKKNALECIFKYCRIEGSKNEGIKIDECAPPIISNCRIVRNEKEGIEIKTSQLQLSLCRIDQNLEDGIKVDDAQLTIYNSLITHNSEDGIESRHANDVINITNVVISDNQNRGVFVNDSDGQLNIINSIVYDNLLEIVSNPLNTDITYSDIKGGYSGPQNIDADPEFNNRSDYTLSVTSPCIDEGYVSGGHNDLYFPPSLGTSQNDMGAYGGPRAGEWYPPLYIEPDSLDFGEVRLDSTKTLNLNINNYRDSIVTVSEVSIDGDSSKVFGVDSSSFSIAVLNSTQLLVTFTPDTQQTFNARLKLTTMNHGNVFVSLTGETVVPEISLLKNNLDFGIIDLGHAWYMDLPIQNSGSDDLIISDIYSTNPVFTVNDTSFIIPPGNILNSLTVTFTPDSAKVYLDSLIIESNDPFQSRATVPLWGEGRGPVVAVDQSAMDFGSVILTSDTTLNLTISNRGNGNLDIEKIEILAGGSSSVSFMLVSPTLVFPFYIDPDSSVTLPIRFKPITAGLDSASLQIESNDPLRDTIYVDLLGKGLAPVIALSDTSINFGDVPVNSDILQTLYIYNHGDAPLIIYKDSLVISGADSVFYIDPVSSDITIMPGDSTELNVYFDALERGVKQAELQIFSNDVLKPQLSVDLTGNGIAPILQLSDNSLDFGSLPVISDSLRILQIYNIGDAELIVYSDSLSITGTGSNAFIIESVTTDISVMPGDSAQLGIRFNALQSGQYQAELYLSCNDPLQPNATISLNGEGIAPVIELSAASLDFGSIAVNSDSLQKLYIYNTGNSELIVYQDSLSITGPDSTDFIIESVTADISVMPGDSAELNIRFTAIQSGQQQAELHIGSNDPLKPTVNIPLSGVGLAPVIELSATDFDFGIIPVNSDSLQKLYIYNTGNTTLIVYHDSINISGPNSNVFYVDQLISDILITPGDSAELNIGFTAIEPGQKQAQLNLSSNDPWQLNIAVNLTGTGFAAAQIDLLV
ncbi:choice-of-anchor D domain-containing protein, partial [Calditrichota bacterium]